MGLPTATIRRISQQVFPHVSSEVREACVTTLQLTLKRVKQKFQAASRLSRGKVQVRPPSLPLTMSSPRQPSAAESTDGSTYIPPSGQNTLAANTSRESMFTPEIVVNSEAEEFYNETSLEDPQRTELGQQPIKEETALKTVRELKEQPTTVTCEAEGNSVTAKVPSPQQVESQPIAPPSASPAAAPRIAREKYRIKKSHWRRPELLDRPVLIPPLPAPPTVGY